jgi:integrase
MRRVYDDLKGESLKPFYASFKSEQTKENYCIKLRHFLDFCNLGVDDFVSLAKSKPAKVDSLLLDYVESRKKEGASGSTLHMARDSIKLLLEMNDAEKVNWKKINRVLPPAKRSGNDRPPTTDEIRKLILHADLKMKSVILLLASSGIRIGALDYLTWGDVEPFNSGKYEFAKLRIYSGEPEEYWTFLSPECYESLLEYRKLRENAGEKISKKSPLISTTLNSRKASAGSPAIPRALNSKVVRNKLGELWKELGNRDKDVHAIAGKEFTKYEIKQAHGFRKFFKSQCERFTKSIYVELMMGHSTGVTASYMKPTIEELAEEYSKAIPSLTITKTEGTLTSAAEMKESFREQLLVVAGFKKEEIGKIDLSETSDDDFQKMLRGKILGIMANNGSKQKVIPVGEVGNHISQGFEFVAALPNGEVVMRVPF